MRIAINAEKVAGAVNTSNEHAIVTKVIADFIGVGSGGSGGALAPLACKILGNF